MARSSPSTAGPLHDRQSRAMGPSLRPFAYRRDPWWDATGRTSRRRRRRRLAAFSAILLVGGTLGLIAGETRAAEPGYAATAGHAAAAAPAAAAAAGVSTR